jgi:hypothetical protein
MGKVAYWGANKMFGMPKGGVGRACLLAFAGVLHVLLSYLYCPSKYVLVCGYPPVLLSILLSRISLPEY